MMRNLSNFYTYANLLEEPRVIKLVLASTSQSRKMLLKNLQIPFECMASNIDEIPLENESPESLVQRLAKEKAEVVANQFSEALIIGADTIGILNHTILSKPLTEENAIEQLQIMSGKTITFLTGLCVLNSKTNEKQIDIDTFDVTFKMLSNEKIKNYLRKEQALGCSGSLKIEGLGIALIEKLSGNDYTALIGLPLIKLTNMFEKLGFPLI